MGIYSNYKCKGLVNALSTRKSHFGPVHGVQMEHGSIRVRVRVRVRVRITWKLLVQYSATCILSHPFLLNALNAGSPVM